MKKKTKRERVAEFLRLGKIIGEKEYHAAYDGFGCAYVGGPQYDKWMNEIKIFASRHLTKHPLYKDIQELTNNHNRKPSAYEDMMGCLRALVDDEEFWKEEREKENEANMNKTEQFMKEDIERCDQFISNPVNEKYGQELYVDITSRYDSIIPDFGNGLYQYYAEQHFYDPEVSGDSLIHNLKVLRGKMITYQSSHFSQSSSKIHNMSEQISKKVFIVHGHDNEAKQEVARTLEKGGFEAVILHEQPDSGRTIIEKIERFSDVCYAIVLYTECDLGRDKNDSVENEKFRARQNVVFEHGYLIGKLGRDRVTALVKGEVETPGDISGVVYTKMDSAGAWKMQLGKNMKDIGISVDMNTFLS